MPVSKRVLCIGIALVGASGSPIYAQTAPPPVIGRQSKPLLGPDEDAVKRMQPSSAQVSVSRLPIGLAVAIASGEENYPGVALKPEGGAWNLSGYGHVEARLTNTGTKDIFLSLRVDNAGDWHANPWNTESVALKPGETRTVQTIFGYAYGFKPNFALKPEAVVQVLIFTAKSDAPQSFRIESVMASGPAGEKPPLAPEDVRIKPPNGFLLGGDATGNVASQFSARNAQNSLDTKGNWRIALPASGDEQTATIQPAQGRWDLRDFLEVRVKIKNEGASAITPRARLESNGGASRWMSATAPLAPGHETEITLPFTNDVPMNLNQKDSTQRVASNSVSGVSVALDGIHSERALMVQSVRAVLPPSPILPDGLGKRPPVVGEWVQTLNENFDGTTIDAARWNIVTQNYWDKRSHFSKDNLLVANGLATLRMEKKRGYDWDDPTRSQTDYAVGYLDSYGKWTQRYGYFEARMKLPSAPGLWPAFWMMPDRGVAAGPEQWKRGDTKNGGMEFDIMEHLTGWGPNRYNIAQHWDGYDKDHQSNGSDKTYLQPDKDGFITCGLLWLPGEVVYYGNGQELLHWKNERISNVPSNLIFYMVTGGWENLPLDDAKLPADFSIDYVRAWQRQDLASPADNNGTH